MITENLTAFRYQFTSFALTLFFPRGLKYPFFKNIRISFNFFTTRLNRVLEFSAQQHPVFSQH